MNHSITPNRREHFKDRFRESRMAIEAMLKQYRFNPTLPLAENMKKLCVCLENVMNLEGLEDFAKFLSNEQHLPIEIDFKLLRYDKLYEIYEDWLSSKEQQSVNLERAYTHKHRNIIFKRVFLEQKDTIREYFQTLSAKQKLKGFDLYQLLTELLSPYFLYELNSDTEGFFQKTNSFENFMKIVDLYISSGRTVYSRDKEEPNDQSYIRLYELQALIEFWESVNPELVIQAQPRKNLKDVGIQTLMGDLNSIECQTDRDHSRSLLSIINNTMQDINFLISKENNPRMLESLDKIFDVLRSQKIFAANYQHDRQATKLAKKHDGKRLDDSIIESMNDETHRNSTPTKPKLLLNKQQGRSNSPLLSRNPNDKYEDEVKLIYRFLCSRENLNSLTLSEFQIFLYQIGLTKAHQTDLLDNIIAGGFVEDRQEITLREFKVILKQLAKQSKRIPALVKDYVGKYIEGEEIRQTAHFNVFNVGGGQAKDIGVSHSKSDFYKNSLADRDKSFQQTSKTTYQINSEDSS